ncbi:hypothetical protein [Amycolatopsis anabasis]|uniref:hypothetical protein n=1 Tax=Amycolatopsis anabasis TaxID=1840409 RepID=UPI001C554D32|nr:hypothetical protein [Amycolatopsis anabasis]
MPQVASWENPGGLAEFPPDYKCTGKGTPKYSFISLDRGAADKLITGEYCSKGSIPDENGRVAQWPLNSETGLPKLGADGNWHADKAFRLPVANVQGAVSCDGTWYLSRTGGGANGNASEAEHFFAKVPCRTLRTGRRSPPGRSSARPWRTRFPAGPRSLAWTGENLTGNTRGPFGDISEARAAARFWHTFFLSRRDHSA